MVRCTFRQLSCQKQKLNALNRTSKTKPSKASTWLHLSRVKFNFPKSMKHGSLFSTRFERKTFDFPAITTFESSPLRVSDPNY
ncbi:hypothetical protein L596_013998 [Steinernema carpocapsae]|uniref:Uncharacterized protein n=1 Tax=Steinernema carpocapsae TaxID=34508 RepID=A0A4V6A2S5_STECR|nr:hypothetical protein L596_013998 [Steinernema carpocapsae]